MNEYDIWKFLAGLGFFLFGMGQLERVLKSVSGRSLKLFLKKNTQNLFKAILGGTIVTGIVQSSSVVSLIVLAFVESGIITFRNALGVILGTNLGTTLTSWIVATVGFKLNILELSYPVIAISAIGMFFLEKRKNLYHLFAIFFSLGILFLGINYMKDAALILVGDFDLSAFAGYGSFVFVIIGFILTTIIQSSSATVAITLTAIYSGVLTFPTAAAVVIGSEIGTTIKVLFWGLKGKPDKKRVAVGNFIYNIFTALTAYAGLSLIIYFIENIVQVKDPLIGLVLFQTTINIISIILFVPFLNVFARWLETKFTETGENENSYISSNLPMMPILSIDAFRNEAANLLNKTIVFNRNTICPEHPKSENILRNIQNFSRTEAGIEGEYKKLKHTEGDLLEYYARLHDNMISNEDAALLLKYIHAIRQSIYSAKSVKDIAHNLKEFEESSNDFLHGQFNRIQKDWTSFDELLNDLMNSGEQNLLVGNFEEYRQKIKQREEAYSAEIISELKLNRVQEEDASSMLNVFREIYSAKKSLLISLEFLKSNGLSQDKNSEISTPL